MAINFGPGDWRPISRLADHPWTESAIRWRAQSYEGKPSSIQRWNALVDFHNAGAIAVVASVALGLIGTLSLSTAVMFGGLGALTLSLAHRHVAYYTTVDAGLLANREFKAELEKLGGAPVPAAAPRLESGGSQAESHSFGLEFDSPEVKRREDLAELVFRTRTGVAPDKLKGAFHLFKWAFEGFPLILSYAPE
jgi:hypothetical protein